jgi:hypothetical protein
VDLLRDLRLPGTLPAAVSGSQAVAAPNSRPEASGNKEAGSGTAVVGLKLLKAKPMPVVLVPVNTTVRGRLTSADESPSGTESSGSALVR